MSWTRSEDPVLDTLQELVAIDSVNPSLPGGAQGESGMVAYLSDFFSALDIVAARLYFNICHFSTPPKVRLATNVCLSPPPCKLRSRPQVYG